jgi:hypothetical protein
MTVDRRLDFPKRDVINRPPQIDSAHLTDEAWVNLTYLDSHRA